MRAFQRAEHIAGGVLIAVVIATLAARSACAEGPSDRQSWAAMGLALAPSPYGLDENGSPVGDVALGWMVRERISIVAAVARVEFSGATPAKFTPVSIGLRAHLSSTHATNGGPYLGVASVVCHASYRDQGSRKARILPGVEATVGTIIPMSASLALDWSASHLLTPDSGGFSPNPLTHSTRRDGLDRGAVRVRLVLRR